jgi:hypothetical protein
MRYSCGCRANLSIVTKEQVRGHVCPDHTPEGRARAAKERQQRREIDQRNLDIQARLDAIFMSQFGPLAEHRP